MDVKENINNLIKQNNVCLFMKGTPDSPQCGFSMTVANILKHLNVKFLGVNVLEDENLRQGIKDLMGDNNHYAAIIKSSLFKNLNKIEQHKLVYKSLKGKMGNELHALSITTEGK